MRWHRLFDDIEGQLDAAATEDLVAEVADRTRREVASLRLRDRIGGATGVRLEIGLVGADPVAGVLRDSGADWLLLDAGRGQHLLVNLGAVLTVRGLPPAAPPPREAMVVPGRLRLGYALRGIARDRSAVVVCARDGLRVEGTIERVGADFFDVTEHPVDEPRPIRARRGCTISVDAVCVVRVT